MSEMDKLEIASVKIREFLNQILMDKGRRDRDGYALLTEKEAHICVMVISYLDEAEDET